VIDHPELRRNVGEGEIFFENHDGRITLMLPYFDRVMLGTTDIRIDHPDQAVLTADEVEYMLDMVKRVFPSITVQREQIVFSFSGVRPLPSMDANTTGQISRDHSIRHARSWQRHNLPHSRDGGKWTTMRAFGEQMSDVVLTRLKHPRAHSTADRAIGGGRDSPHHARSPIRLARAHGARTRARPSRVQTLFERYGTYAEPIIAHCANRPSDPLDPP
jgi:glycerol-3-phosphate dehydrogenase